MRRLLSILLALGLLLSLSLVTAVPAQGADIDVPGDYATIQAAIDAATAGDTIYVAANTYSEDITLVDEVDVLGAGASVTIIYGSHTGPVVQADGVGAGTTFDGFTVTNGAAGVGGGMYNNNSSPLVSNCVFTGNSATLNGGGMYNYDHSSPMVTNCVFTGNSAGNWGGGIDCQEYSSPIITNCVIANNSAGNSGGGIYSHMTPAPIITNNTIVKNSAGNSGGGIGVNGATDKPVITNNIIYDNTATNGSGVYCANPPLDIDYNDVFNNTLVGCTSNHDPSADPLFEDELAGDYHLQVTSPCIDAGDNSAPALPSTDFDGEPRIYPTGGTVDIGADEYYIPPSPTPTPAPRGAVGGTVHPIDKAALLLPWFILGAALLLALAAGGLILIRRR
jgi:parallel beta-helix repeat protein/predicted outer membrane repeat protein